MLQMVMNKSFLNMPYQVLVLRENKDFEARVFFFIQ